MIADARSAPAPPEVRRGRRSARSDRVDGRSRGTARRRRAAAGTSLPLPTRARTRPSGRTAAWCAGHIRALCGRRHRAPSARAPTRGATCPASASCVASWSATWHRPGHWRSRGSNSSAHPGCRRRQALAIQFLLEAAEHPVPDDEDSAVVAIKIGIVDGMMHAVIGRRAEPAVEPARACRSVAVHPRTAYSRSISATTAYTSGGKPRMAIGM